MQKIGKKAAINEKLNGVFKIIEQFKKNDAKSLQDKDLALFYCSDIK